MNYMFDGMGWWMIFGFIVFVLFWGGIIWLIVWGVRKLSNQRASGKSPLDIAKERYARGEISKDQFEQIRKDIS
jgi:putative membrane protein